MSASNLEIRVAETQSEREAIYRLRYELFVAARAPLGDEADHDERWLCEAEDAHAVLFLAESDGEVVGTGRLTWAHEASFDQDTYDTYELARFADVIDTRDIVMASQVMVTADHRQGALVVKLFTAMFDYVVDHGAELLIGHCVPHQVRRYGSFGFRPYNLGEHPTHGPLVCLAFVMSDPDYASEVGSPFCAALGRRSANEAVGRALSKELETRQSLISETHARERFWAEVEDTLPAARLAEQLGGLTDEELETMLAHSQTIHCDAGSTLIRTGHASRSLYILLTGSLIVRDGGVEIATVREPGSIVGEVTFFADGRRMSDVIVSGEGARVLALSQRTLEAMIDARGSGAAKFLFAATRGLCDKLRERSDAGNKERQAELGGC